MIRVDLNSKHRRLRKLFLCVVISSLSACNQDSSQITQSIGAAINDPAQIASTTQAAGPLPYSDPTNEGNWVLNTEISDEFDGDTLDRDRWFIEGENDNFYIWKGRAPSQFAPHNVIVEDGKLKLRTQWEPDYPFAQESYSDGSMGSAPYGKLKDGTPMPVTTAGVLTHKRFLNGYMEVKSKVGNAAITGAFWAIGYEQELDVYELMGNPKVKDGHIRENNSLATAHDWSPPALRPTKVFNHIEPLPYRVADDFHVFGAEWGIDYLHLYIDGKLVHSVTQKQVGTDWVLNNPMEVWLDSEIFYWLGYPHKEELPVDFEIEYMRVWQKPSSNILEKDRAFFSFEGPILFEENPRPLNLLPENSENNDYQKFWEISTPAQKYWSIVKGDYSTGINSLRFSGYGKNEKFELDKASVISPDGAIQLPVGDFTLSMKIWLDNGYIPKKIHTYMDTRKIHLEFSELDALERRQWVTLEKDFSRITPSNKNDNYIIEVLKEDLPETKAAKFFIDDIRIYQKNK